MTPYIVLHRVSIKCSHCGYEFYWITPTIPKQIDCPGCHKSLVEEASQQ